MKKIFVLVALLLAVPCMALAAMDLDLRFKGGAAAGLNEMNIVSGIGGIVNLSVGYRF